MSKNSQRIQILIGKRTYEPLKEWYQNQVNPNESARRILEHFIRIYGTEDVNSYEIQKKMAKESTTPQEYYLGSPDAALAGPRTYVQPPVQGGEKKLGLRKTAHAVIRTLVCFKSGFDETTRPRKLNWSKLLGGIGVVKAWLAQATAGACSNHQTKENYQPPFEAAPLWLNMINR